MLSAALIKRAECLQMHTLRLLERLLAVDYTALSLLRGLDLWGATYSTSFFGFAEDQASPGVCQLMLSGVLKAVLKGCHLRLRQAA